VCVSSQLNESSQLGRAVRASDSSTRRGKTNGVVLVICHPLGLTPPTRARIRDLHDLRRFLVRPPTSSQLQSLCGYAPYLELPNMTLLTASLGADHITVEPQSSRHLTLMSERPWASTPSQVALLNCCTALLSHDRSALPLHTVLYYRCGDLHAQYRPTVRHVLHVSGEE